MMRRPLLPVVVAALLWLPWRVAAQTAPATPADPVITYLQELQRAGTPTSTAQLKLKELTPGENAATFYRRAFDHRTRLLEQHHGLADVLPVGGKQPWEKLTPETKSKVIQLFLKDPDFDACFAWYAKVEPMKCRFFTDEELLDYFQVGTAPERRAAGALSIERRLHALAAPAGAGPVAESLGTITRNVQWLACRAFLEARYGDPAKAYLALNQALQLTLALDDDPRPETALTELSCLGVVLRQLRDLLEVTDGPLKDMRALLQRLQTARPAMPARRAVEAELVAAVRAYAKEGREGRVPLGVFYEARDAGTADVQTLAAQYKQDPRKFWQEEYQRFCQIARYNLDVIGKPSWELEADLETKLKTTYPGPLSRQAYAQMTVYRTEVAVDAYLAEAELGLACRLYRLQFRRFPASLTALVPLLVPTLPTSPQTGRELIYEPRDQGFLIYPDVAKLNDENGLPRKEWDWDRDQVWHETGTTKRAK